MISEISKLKEALTNINAPVLDHLNPGLTKEQIDEIVTTRNRGPVITIPDEFYHWFNWQNSINKTAAETGKGGCSLIAAPGYELAPLEQLFNLMDIISDAAEEWATADLDFMKQPLLPVLALHGDPVVIQQAADNHWRMYYHDQSEWEWQPIPQQTPEATPPTLPQWTKALTQAITEQHITCAPTGNLCWHQEMTAPEEHQNYPWKPCE